MVFKQSLTAVEFIVATLAVDDVITALEVADTASRLAEEGAGVGEAAL